MSSFRSRALVLIGGLNVAARGRPKKTGVERWPCGKPKSPSVVAKIIAAQQEADRRAKEIVMSQPHRRGFERPDDPMLAYPLGRFCLAYRLRGEIRDAAEMYFKLLYGWHAAKGLPVVGGLSGRGGGEPLDVPATAEMLANVERKIGSIEIAMVAASHPGMLAAKRLIWGFDGSGEDIPSALHDNAMDALMAAAVHFGLLKKGGHPWQGS